MPQATLLPQATHLALILQNNTFSAHFSSYAVLGLTPQPMLPLALTPTAPTTPLALTL